MNARALKILAATKLLPLLLLLALPTLVQAQFTFTTNSGAITITGYNTAAGLNAIIPAATNGYPVTSIGFAAFQDGSITSVTIPNSVTNIADYAFYYNYNLTSVTIPNSVTSIGNEAFYYCYSLTNLTIGTSVTGIGSNAFENCYSLKIVTIPNSVINISDGAFNFCTGLTNFTVNASNPAYGSLSGVLFDKAQATLILFPEGLGGSYTVPNSVTGIGDGAFSACYSLTNVTIGTGVTSIGDYAFEGDALTSVTIPVSVTSIGEGAFYYCTSLANFTVNASNLAYSSLGGVLFDKAQATLIQFPASLGGSYAIPNGVASIGKYAFHDCTSLTSVTIPNSVTSIGDDAFGYCSSLTSMTIPQSVTSIGGGAFYYCSGLTSVTIPQSVTNIGDGAFFYCYLTSAYFQGNAPPDDGTAFIGDSLAILYYLPGTTGWGSTFGSVPAVLWNPQANTLGVTGGHFGFSLSGPANAVIVVEACTNLSNPVWLPVSTNTLSGSGTSPFSDQQPGNYPKRFYRFRSP